MSAHEWDTERSAILVTEPEKENNPDSFSAQEAYFAAHEGVPFLDKSRFHKCGSSECGVNVYWSEGKHASYPGEPKKYFRFEGYSEPPFISKAGTYRLFDIGTVEDAYVPWVRNKSWGSGVGSVYEKMKDSLWDLKTWKRKERISYARKDIETFQEFKDLPVTGELNRDTIEAVYDVDYRLIENMDKFSKSSFQILSRSRTGGKDIELLARHDFSEGEIERIAQKNLHGAGLKKYLKD